MSLHDQSDSVLAQLIIDNENLINDIGLFPPADKMAKQAARRKLEVLKNILSTDDPIHRIILDEESLECKAIVERLSKYADENPYKTYQDRDECLDGRPDFVQKLLDCTTEDEISEWYYSLYEELEESYLNCDYDYEGEYWKEAWGDAIVGSPDFPFVPSRHRLEGQVLRDLCDLLRSNDVYMQFDHSGHVDDIIGSTNVKVRAVVRMANGDRIETPHFENDEGYNRELALYLNRVFKMENQLDSKNWSDANYGGSYMVFMGDLDLMEIIRTKKVPNTLDISKGDRYVFFAGWNGSGSGFEPMIQRGAQIRCEFLVDDAKCNRYGVDETYGFVHRVWADNHNAFHYEWPDDVEAFVETKSRTWKKLKVK